MANAYSHFYGLLTTGLGFFNVYGPWDRPDIAVYLFTRAIFEGRPIRLCNDGKVPRDFTCVDDIVRLVEVLQQPNPDWSGDDPRSILELCALVHPQHLQPSGRRSDPIRARAGRADRPQGNSRNCLASSGRRRGDLCRRHWSRRSGGLTAIDPALDLSRTVRRVVSPLSRRLTTRRDEAMAVLPALRQPISDDSKRPRTEWAIDVPQGG